MAMTIVMTRNLPDRYRGFLASAMHELAPGVYADPVMTRSVRERIWQVMIEWQSLLAEDGGIMMVWPQKSEPSGMAMSVLGWPKKELINHEGFWLTHRAFTAQDDPDDLLELQNLPE